MTRSPKGLLRTGKVAVVLAALALVALHAGQDTRPAEAGSPPTKILFSESNTAPNSINTLTMLRYGPAETVYVWVKDVNDPQGAGAFEVGFSYDPTLITIQTLTHDDDWITSTGRVVSCGAGPSWPPTPPYVRPIPSGEGAEEGLWEGYAGCSGIGAPPPAGPNCASGDCDGLLATITLVPGSTISESLLDITGKEGQQGETFAKSKVLDTGWIEGQTVHPPEEIAFDLNSLTLNIIKCPDIIPPGGDGSVALADIFELAGAFGMTSTDPGWDPAYDLDDDGAISIGDIFDAAGMFGTVCPVAP